MPDPNKLEALKNADYKIVPTCGTCVHMQSQRNSKWGTCEEITYSHGKHTGEPRNASVHASGCCFRYVANLSDQADLIKSGFDQFREER